MTAEVTVSPKQFKLFLGEVVRPRGVMWTFSIDDPEDALLLFDSIKDACVVALKVAKNLGTPQAVSIWIRRMGEEWRLKVAGDCPDH